MKPNDKAYAAARKVAYNRINKCFVFDLIKEAVDAAYAAQFQSEDYAGLVKELRSPAMIFYEYSADKGSIIRKAADALESVLAERDALKAVVEIYEKKLNGIEDEIRLATQSAIAAVRPHIEAAERERCAQKILETNWVDADPEEIAAAIRSGK